jgi:hypothetical protein
MTEFRLDQLPPHCGNVVRMQSLTRALLPSVVAVDGTQWARPWEAEPRAFETLACSECEFAPFCAMTGEARTAMPMAVMITFKLIFIVDLISVIVAPGG